MRILLIISITFFSIVQSFQDGSSEDTELSFYIHFPDRTIDHDYTPIFFGKTIPINKTFYITKFTPHFSENVVQYIVVDSCNNPEEQQGTAWAGGFKDARCKGTGNVMWTTGRNESYELPEGIAYRVGPGTAVNYLVLSALFVSKETANANHSIYNTGMTISGTTRPPQKVAGLYSFISKLGSPVLNNHLDLACRYNESFALHPFAFAAYAHLHGVDAMAYRVRNNHWTLIGRDNPNNRIAFAPLANQNLLIENGDWLAARCVTEYNRNETIVTGFNYVTDAMFSYFIMYWIPIEHADFVPLWDGNTCMENTSIPWSHYLPTLPSGL